VAGEPDAVERGLGAGQRAMDEASRAVHAAAGRFGSTRPALRLMLGAAGRIVVTGLGKSGLVGAKLAATLASTGAPSVFVHAADALHGDAGMVTAGDVLLAISKSGETIEVVRFAGMAAARDVPVIAMTGCDGRSSLCRLATAVLDVGVEREADPWDLVPSTSTTVCVAVGDALAIAMMVARDLGPGDFLAHHPGGTLGARLRAQAVDPGTVGS
jgi:arabinose-5-phosphate isomerase